MKFIAVLALCLAQVLCVPSPQGGSFVTLFNKLQDRFADGVVEDVIKMRRITKKVKSRCYNDEKKKEAIKECGGGEDDFDPENIVKIFQADSEVKKAAIIHKVKQARAKKSEILRCVAEKLGVLTADGSDINEEGVKNMINESVIIEDEDVKNKITEKTADCINLSQSCGLVTVKEKVKVLFSCLKPRMMAICVASQIKQKLGIDFEDDIDAL